MKIVDRNTFLALPANTLFSKYSPCVFGELRIKGESLVNDFLEQEITGAIDYHNSNQFHDDLERASETGCSLRMDFETQGRDGCFDDDSVLFAVWEPDDVKALIARLQRCLGAVAGKEEKAGS